MRVTMWASQVGIQCDSCLASVTDHDGAVRCWAAGEDIDAVLAREHAEWVSLGGGGHRCPRCVARQGCVSVGHDWDEWEPIAHTEDELVVRVCLRCGEDHIVPAYALAPARTRLLLVASASTRPDSAQSPPPRQQSIA